MSLKLEIIVIGNVSRHLEKPLSDGVSWASGVFACDEVRVGTLAIPNL